MHPPRLIGAAIGLFASVAIVSTPAMATPCTDLQSVALENATITSATDNTTGTFVVPNTNPPQTITNLPAFCRVTATLTPTTDSAIKIEVWLPANTWNGRFLGTGGGGFQGNISYAQLASGIQAGFAATNSDLGTGVSGCTPLFCGSAGHKGNPLAIAFGAPATPTTGLFGHPERIKDFGYRAIHLMTLRGKEITQAFYQQKAAKAYFAGCSTGGQNALMEAQRFPDDYDGILAGAPAFQRTHLHIAAISLWQAANASPARRLQPGQLTLINKAVLAQCAGRDGGVSTDQFLTDPRLCRFDPKILQCTDGNAPPACLTADQVTTMQKYYAGAIDPVNGQLISPGAARGAETDNVLALGFALLQQLPEPGFDGLFYWVYGSAFGDLTSATNFANFDFHRDVHTVDHKLAGVLNAVSTDLSEFQDRGGKLIIWHGSADPLIAPQNSINYFNALVGNNRHQHVGRPDHHQHGGSSSHHEHVTWASHHEHGGRGKGKGSALEQTQSYARLYMAPGVYHCSGGPGPNVFDLLTPLVTWVETGVAPETLVAAKFVNDTGPGIQMTRPLCVYPKVPRYNGSGDSNVAASFTCVNDKEPFNQTPAPKYGP